MAITVPGIRMRATLFGGMERAQTAREELANALCHGVALLAAGAALPVLVIDAGREGSAGDIVAAAIFGATILLLYLSSTIYHALPAGRAKQVFRTLDHCAIFLLIAGTYTPFVLGALRGAWGWSLFGIVWGIALFGILHKLLFPARSDTLSTALYLAMGWLVIIAARPMIDAVPLAALIWLTAGGLAYTLGVVFFVIDNRVRYAHCLWHVFVAAGSFCHVMAVLRTAGA